jgi:hypothetical protein
MVALAPGGHSEWLASSHLGHGKLARSYRASLRAFSLSLGWLLLDLGRQLGPRRLSGLLRGSDELAEDDPLPSIMQQLISTFGLRSVDPGPAEIAGRVVTGVRRLGKRIVIALDGERFVLIHLMIAGRLHWKEAGAKLPGKIGLAALDFSTGTVTLTEAGSKRRAAIHLIRGEAALAAHDPGGLELGDADPAAFRAAITRESHTLKRTLTDPRIRDTIEREGIRLMSYADYARMNATA